MEAKNVVVLPCPFGSQRITLPNLVFKLAPAAPNVVFSYISPPQHNREVFFSKPNNYIPHNVKCFDISDGVPEGHLPRKNPIDKIDFFLKYCPQNLKRGVVDLAEKRTNLKVTCILSDVFVTPSLTVAQELNAPWIATWLCLSTTMSPPFYTHIVHQHCTKHGMESDKLVDFLPRLSQMRISDLPYESRLQGEDNETELSRTLSSIGNALPQAKAVVMNLYEELDPPLFVEDMRSKLQSLLYVGFLTLSPDPSSPLPLPPPLMDPSGCLEWLDNQRRRSVVYICFGTVTVPPPPELVAIAEVLVGHMGTGKTSLVLRFVKGQFSEYQESTIGAAFFTQVLSLNECTVKFDIWDTAGQERYHSLAIMYYRGAAAAIVVYDITTIVSRIHSF